MNHSKIVFICFLMLTAIIWIFIPFFVIIYPYSNTHYFWKVNAAFQPKSTHLLTLNSHSPVEISSDNQFVSYSFPGSGTLTDPYRIEHLNITLSNGNLISISNTSFYFYICNNFLNGLSTATSGISLSNVYHGIIENNTILNTQDGIKGSEISNIFIRTNNISSCVRFGIFLTDVADCTLSSNLIHSNLINGIQVKDSSRTVIRYNIIYNHHHADLPQSSILLDHSSDSLISNNMLFNNHYGINFLNSADNNHFTNNSILMSQGVGIRLEYVSKNILEFNAISDNLNYGVFFTLGTTGNIFQFNNLTHNNDGNIQAKDDGSKNVFVGNYWDDWNGLDEDGDFIIDVSYPIDGSARNLDPFPLVEFSCDAIQNVETDSGNLGLISAIVIIFGGGTALSFYLYKTKFSQQDNLGDFAFNESFIGFDLSKQLEYVKSLYDKLVVGLEYIKGYFLPQPVIIPLLPASDSATLTEFFPSSIKEDLQSGLKWRTIQTLIEIAYQNPIDTNPKKLAKNLNFPLSSISSEIKKLKALNYIETFVSAQVMRDGRYRNFTITQKGYELLYTLKETLNLTLTRLKEQDELSFAVK